jgi:hypothetical protein
MTQIWKSMQSELSAAQFARSLHLRICAEPASKKKIGSQGKMSKAIEARTYEEALAWLREHGFDVTEAPGMNGRVFLRKYNVSAAIQKNAEDGVKIFAYPGYLVGSEISKLVNRGYQQFLKNSKTEVPATADHLKALQSFAEELKVALGLPSLYNESLGTVSDSYHYDRLKDDDKAPVDRPKRPWEVAGKAVAVKKGRA